MCNSVKILIEYQIYRDFLIVQILICVPKITLINTTIQYCNIAILIPERYPSRIENNAEMFM